LTNILVAEKIFPAGDDVKDLLRIRECSIFLFLLQNTDLFADKLNFRLEKWVQEQFLGFADLFLRTYQEAQLNGGAADLETGRELVLRTLRVANLEPVEITLGKTPFDSSQHVGRSTASRLDLEDGTIASVVRNGFRQATDGTVMRQPEVIVNRR
jgi:molecular chaperone GrpE (heat shock protein)